MAASVVFLSESEVKSLLRWDDTFKAVEAALKGVSSGRVVQTARTFTNLEKKKNVLLTMPGYLEDAKYGSLACKLVTAADENEKRVPPLPNILANIALFDDTTGELRAIIAATEITGWRTAAASAVATKYLHVNRKGKKCDVLAIMGAGAQGKYHAICFQHFFNFKKVNIWNRSPDKAIKLVNELNSTSERKEFTAYSSVDECVKEADVIVTATSSPSPFIKLKSISPGVHINAVGAGAGHHHSELENEIYRSSDIYIDHWAGARSELYALEESGVQFRGEIGELIGYTDLAPPKDPSRITVFQSLGMATEDCAMARMIYDLYKM